MQPTQSPQVPRPFLRPHEVEECQRDIARLDDIISRPDPEGKLQKADAQRARRRVEQRMTQAPPDLTPAARDKASKRLAELEGEIREGMLSHEEMRRNPPGATDHHINWERRNKNRIQEWKNLQLALNKGIPSYEASEMCSIERLRPRTSRLNMDGAQIPQVTSYHHMAGVYDSGHPASASYEDIFGSGDPARDSAVQQAREAQAELRKLAEEKAKLEAQLAELRNAKPTTAAAQSQQQGHSNQRR